jgi:hypothetical protein
VTFVWFLLILFEVKLNKIVLLFLDIVFTFPTVSFIRGDLPNKVQKKCLFSFDFVFEVKLRKIL